MLCIAVIPNFEYSFMKFHTVLFKNDFWVLDPNKSIIINLLPENFFIDAFKGVIVLSGFISFAVAVAMFRFYRLMSRPIYYNMVI